LLQTASGSPSVAASARSSERRILEEVIPGHKIKVIGFALFGEAADEFGDGYRARRSLVNLFLVRKKLLYSAA
jgi:hypothetical protein